MFNSKLEVDRHVENCLKKIKSETERNVRCLSFAKLYYKVGDYEQARRYVLSYLIAKPLSAEGQLLLGQILEKLGKLEAALQAYKASLDIDYKQKNVVLKVCELLTSSDGNFNVQEAKYYCEQAQSFDPHNPVIFVLKEKLVAAESGDPNAVTTLLLKELESRPTDVNLRVRLLRHLLQTNQVKEAYRHTAAIEVKDTSLFQNSLSWYEIATQVLYRYQTECLQNPPHDYWILLISVLDRLVILTLDEHRENLRTSAECVNAVFNFDQTLGLAAERLTDFPDRQLLQHFLNHYVGQLCFHLSTLMFKQAKKSLFKYKEVLYLSLPLLFKAHHLQPPELNPLWCSEQDKIKRWHKEATFRCSQTGRVLLSAAKDRRAAIIENAQVHSTGLWREQLFKKLFTSREHQGKMRNGFFVSCQQLLEIPISLPEPKDVLEYSEKAQLVYPDSLHLYIWAGIDQQLSQFKCIAFEGLQYSSKNLQNCSAESLSILDIEAFLLSSILCAHSIKRTKHSLSEPEKPMMPAFVTEPLGTVAQSKWLRAAYKMYRNEFGADLSEIRLILIKGIEVVRCVGNHGMDVKLLIRLSDIFAQRVKHLNKQSEIEANEARAELYWKTALPILEKLKNGQAVTYGSANELLFDYKTKELTSSDVCVNLDEGKLYLGRQLMKRKDYEKAAQIFESLKDPYASFYQAQMYKSMAETESNEQQQILLSKARDCLYLSLDRLREPSIDRKHPLNAILGSEIENVERMIFDPESVNRNECDGMSDENDDDATKEHFITPNASMRHTSFVSTSSATTPYKMGRREARPSPERLDAQLRQLTATRDTAINTVLDQNRLLMEAHRNLVDELRTFREAVTHLTTSVDDLKSVTASDVRGIRQSVEELKNSVDDLQNFRTVTDMVQEIKKEMAEMKRDAVKQRSNAAQLTEEDLYPLDEEFSAEYGMGTNVGAFNPALYPNYQMVAAAANARLQPPASFGYPPPAIYPSMYPTMAYHYGLGLPQAGGLPLGAEQQLAADLRVMNSLSLNQSAASLSQPGYPPPQTVLPPQAVLPPLTLTQPPIFGSQNSSNTPISSVYPTSSTSQIPPLFKDIPKPLDTTPKTTAPVNVVITASDPLPTSKTITTTAQPILSVTIPPQHLKGNQTPKTQPHNYQIPLPSASVATASVAPSVLNQAVAPISTQSLLSNVAPPVYSSLPDKSLNKSNAGLGLQIEKSLSQTFNSSAVSDKSNVSLDEHDPCPDFKPIIPLPDQVPVNTGEENEITLFGERAKLFRYVDKEWRERGVGVIKILRHPGTGKVRILMRRDQVHKICANHFLTEDMALTPMPNNEKAYMWAANDFADEQVILEKLCVRFKTPEEATRFYKAFQEAKKDLPSDKASPAPKLNQSTPDKVQISAVAQEGTSLGGFVFTNTPTFKPKEDIITPAKQVIQDTPKQLSPFATFSFGSKTSTPLLFGVTNSEFKPVKPLSETSDVEITELKSPNKDNDTSGTDFVPTAEFKPVVPLPDIVDVKTGEENAKVLYEYRAKLLRYDGPTKEWKERGLGTMKILSQDGTVRLVMRREHVHKVCCNHQLLKDTKFEKMQKTPKAVMWAAQDFSEDVLKSEMFAIRFKNEEQADAFLKAVKDAQTSLNENNIVASSVTESKLSKVKHWPEGHQHVKFKPNIEEKAKTETAPSWGDKFKPKSGSWECKTCYIVNEGKANYCEACDTPKNDTVPKKDQAQKVPEPTFSFGVATAPEKKPTSFLFGQPKTESAGFGDVYKPKQGSWECEQCCVRNDADKLYCVCCDAPKDKSVPDKNTSKGINLETPGLKFNFGIPSSATQPKPAATYNFGSSGFTFNVKPAESNKEATPVKFDSVDKPFAFKSSPVEESKKKDEKTDKEQFVFGSPQKHDFEFVPRSPRRYSGGQGDDESDGGSYLEEEADNIYFKPVIPLPDKVEVKTGEEQEEVVYCHRAKLYRFVGGEWKERGVGDLKILRKTDTGKLRVVMRRDQVLKICLNHVLTSDIEYISKDDKTWLFSAPDFSEGEINHQQFCLRFKTSEIAEEFKNAVDAAIKKMAPSSQIEKEADSDVEFVSETKVTPEEEAEAKKLGLPPKFMAYRQLPDCKCDQCKKEDTYLENKPSTPFFGTPTSDTLGVISPLADTPKSSEFSFSSAKSETPKEDTLKSLLLKPSVFGSISKPKEETKESIFSNTNSSTGKTFFSSGTTPAKTSDSGSVFNNFSFSLGAETTASSTFSPAPTEGLFSNRKSIFGSPFAFTPAVSIFSNNTGTTSSNIFGNGSIFGSQSGSTVDNTASLTMKSKSIFAVPTVGTPSAETQPEGVEVKTEVILPSDPSLSFATLAAKNSGTPAFASKGDGDANNPFGYLGAGAPVFGSSPRKPVAQKKSAKTTTEDQEEEGEADEGGEDYDPHYEPIVPLPEAIVVSTGEEEETILFVDRAKLFRFDADAKEWKERGVGQLKLLHHPVNNTYRFLLRREQVHKVVLNQLITADMELQRLSTSDRAWLWVGYNHTEDETALEKLAARFKNPQLANEFYTAAQKAITAVKERDVNNSKSCIPATVETYEDISGDEYHQEEPVVEEVDDEEDDDDYDDDDRCVMFMRRCTLSEQGLNGEWNQVTEGDLQVYFDAELYGARVSINDDTGCIVSNTIIGINTVMKLENNTCTWKAVEWASEEEGFDWRTLKATFGTEKDAEEFYMSYQEGVNYAEQCDIIDDIPGVSHEDVE